MICSLARPLLLSSLSRNTNPTATRSKPRVDEDAEYLRCYVCDGIESRFLISESVGRDDEVHDHGAGKLCIIDGVNAIVFHVSLDAVRRKMKLAIQKQIIRFSKYRDILVGSVQF